MKFKPKDDLAALVLPPGKNELFIWDDDMPGFGLRLRGDTKRWYCQYRVGAQQRRESLGDIRRIDLEAARKAAKQRFAQAELGVDPQAEKAKAKTEATANKLTLAEVARRYLKAKSDQVKPRTYSQIKLHLEEHFASLANRPIGLIKRADVAVVLQDLIESKGRIGAARARSNLSGMFGWAMKEGLCEANPVAITNNPEIGVKSRDRVLSDDELRAVWRACEHDDFGRIVRLLVLTGARREEIGHLKWSEIDLNNRTLNVSGDRIKNHRDLHLILPVLAIDILRATPRRNDRDHIFGGGSNGFSAWSYNTLALNRRLPPMPHWTLHDLRRTFRTGLGRLGVAPHVAELAINHTQEGIVAVYDKHKYALDIKAALQLWADHIALLVT